MNEINENNVASLINNLNRETNSVIHIEKPSGTLTVIGSQYQRVKVYFIEVTQLSSGTRGLSPLSKFKMMPTA
jgi:hypothetical protein